jgi:flagellar motility protein MotE (MotC chaperone)
LVLALLKLALISGMGVESLTLRLAETVIQEPLIRPAQAQAQTQDAQTQDAQKQDAATDPAVATEATPEGARDDAPPPEGVSPLDWKALKDRERELVARERSLKALETELDQKLATIEKRNKELRAMLDEAKLIKDKKVKHLVDVYSNMKAQQAAQVLESLDMQLAVKILSGMRGRQAGEILTYVSADKAAKLSEALTKLSVPFDEQQQ